MWTQMNLKLVDLDGFKLRVSVECTVCLLFSEHKSVPACQSAQFQSELKITIRFERVLSESGSGNAFLPYSTESIFFFYSRAFCFLTSLSFTSSLLQNYISNYKQLRMHFKDRRKKVPTWWKWAVNVFFWLRNHFYSACCERSCLLSQFVTHMHSHTCTHTWLCSVWLASSSTISYEWYGC